MKKLTKLISTLEGLKSESSIGNVREILSLAAKVLGVEYATTTEQGVLLAEMQNVLEKAETKAKKLLAKNPDMTFEELIRRVTNRK